MSNKGTYTYFVICNAWCRYLCIQYVNVWTIQLYTLYHVTCEVINRRLNFILYFSIHFALYLYRYIHLLIM